MAAEHKDSRPAAARVPLERHNHRLLSLSQDRRARLLRPGLHVLDRRKLAPLRHRLGVRWEKDTLDRFLILLTPQLPA